MLLSMIRLLARLVERQRGTASRAVDSFLNPTTSSCLATRNGAGRITSKASDTMPALVPGSTAADERGWPESASGSLRQLWAELAQRQVRPCPIREKEHHDIQNPTHASRTPGLRLCPAIHSLADSRTPGEHRTPVSSPAASPATRLAADRRRSH